MPSMQQLLNASYIHVPWQRSMSALLSENAVKVCVLQTIDTNSRDLGCKPPETVVDHSSYGAVEWKMPSKPTTNTSSVLVPHIPYALVGSSAHCLHSDPSK